MTEVGGVFTATVTLSNGSFTTLFAPSGEQIKITMALGKEQANGVVDNRDVNTSPANGSEADPGRGIRSDATAVPPIGANHRRGSADTNSLQPIFITDSDGLYIGNDSSSGLDVKIQGVRVA